MGAVPAGAACVSEDGYEGNKPAAGGGAAGATKHVNSSKIKAHTQERQVHGVRLVHGRFRGVLLRPGLLHFLVCGLGFFIGGLGQLLLVLGLLLLELGLLTFEGGDQRSLALFGRLDYFAGKLAQIIVQRLCLFAAKKAHVVGVRGGPLWHARGARPYGAASERARVEVRVREGVCAGRRPAFYAS